MTEENKPIQITDTIPYKPIHKHYGRAEFQICPVYKNGYIDKLYIYRKQQDEKESYVLDVKKDKIKVNIFHITSWSHRTSEPNIWMNGWCKTHKTILFNVYVPNDTSKICFEYNFGNTLTIRFE